jgi:hypothetical protein
MSFFYCYSYFFGLDVNLLQIRIYCHKHHTATNQKLSFLIFLKILAKSKHVLNTSCISRRCLYFTFCNNLFRAIFRQTCKVRELSFVYIGSIRINIKFASQVLVMTAPTTNSIETRRVISQIKHNDGCYDDLPIVFI